jgi:hypothetical protein
VGRWGGGGVDGWERAGEREGREWEIRWAIRLMGWGREKGAASVLS